MPPPPDPIETTPADLLPRLSRAGTDFHLIDVRELYELDRGILPAAQSLPMSTLPEHLAEIPRDIPLIIYCEHGVRSYDVAAYLQQQGFNAKSLTGGFAAWLGPLEPYRG